MLLFNKKFKKELLYPIIFLTILSWVFLGYPQIWPPQFLEQQDGYKYGFRLPSELNQASAATSSKTFVFASDAETWAYTDDNASCSGAFTSGTGNPAGSLQTTGSKGGGAIPCNTFWEWSGTWESLGVPAGATVTGVTGSYEYAVSADNSAGTWDTGAFELRDSGSTLRKTLVSALTGQTGTRTFTQRSGTEQTFTGEGSNTSIKLRLNTVIAFGGGNRDWTGQNDNIAVTVTYSLPSTFEQSAYRWFGNNDSTQVGSVLAPQDASTTLTSTGQEFRLRLLMHVAGGSASPGSENFKLQFATSTPGGCDENYSGETYTDVLTASGDIRFKNNTTPSDGALLTATSTDPTHSAHSIVNQTYEEANNFTVTSTIAAGSDGKWDFSLVDFSSPADTTYCFRVAKSTGSTITTSTATKIPEIKTAPTPASPKFTQSGYRWFANNDSTDVGSPLAGLNTSTTLSSDGEAFRLRLLLHTASATATAGGQNFKLQIATSTPGGCDANFTGETYVDFGGEVLSEGPLSAGEGATSTNSGSIATWGTGGTLGVPNNVTSSDGVDVASESLSQDNYTDYLIGKNYGFSIPTSASIKGIKYEVQKAESGEVIEDLTDHHVYIVKNDTVQTTVDRADSSLWPEDFNYTYFTYGSSTELWGQSWTPSDINSSGFGGSISAVGATTGFTEHAHVDHMRMTVYYTDPKINANNNASATDGALVTSNVNDPTHNSDTVRLQTYQDTVSSFLSFSATTSIAVGEDGLWDFSMVDASAPGNTTYCFRVVNSDDSLLDSYVEIPEVTTSAATGNSAPTVSNVVLNSGSIITLVENTSTSISLTGTATDLDGNANISTATATIYRSGVGATCTEDSNSCYQVPSGSCAKSNCSGNSCDFTCTTNIWYFADPTDASSTFSSNDWQGSMTATDASSTTGEGSTASGVELNTLWAINVTPSINYGQVGAGSDTNSTNQTATVTNTGNAEIDIELSGTDLTKGADSISVGNQKYATSTFTYSSCTVCTALSTSPFSYNIDLVKATTSTSPVTDNTFWGLSVPSNATSGTYNGTITFSAIKKINPPFNGPATIGDSRNLGSGFLTDSARQIVRTSVGNFYAVLTDRFNTGDGSDDEVTVWKSIDDGTTWVEQDASNRPRIDGIFNEVSATIDGSGIIHIINYEPFTDTNLLYTQFNTSTDTFGSPTDIFDCTPGGESQECHLVDIAVDSNSIPHIVFRIFDDGLAETKLLYMNKVGGSWNTEVLIENATSSTIKAPSITISEDNVPEVAYVLNPGTPQLKAALGNGNNATSFSKTIVDSSVFNSHPSITIDSDGNTWIGYIDENGASDFVALVKHNDLDAWGTWQTPLNNSVVGTEPSVATVATTSYIFFTDSSSNIAYDRYTGSWLGKTVLESGTFTRVKAKWRSLFDNGNSTAIDYLFNDASDVWYNRLDL